MSKPNLEQRVADFLAAPLRHMRHEKRIYRILLRDMAALTLPQLGKLSAEFMPIPSRSRHKVNLALWKLRVERMGEGVKFFVGLHQPSDAHHFERCMVSVNRLRDRVSDFSAGEWMLDSGAFSELKDHGRFRDSPEVYAAQATRWSRCGNMVAAVSQDYMCEPFILERTGLTTLEHQSLTISRYRKIRTAVPTEVYILPVLQGYWADEYLAHLNAYGDLIQPGQWVGVGSVCKRNADVGEIEHVLVTIHRARPDLRLHGFGVKLTALKSSLVRECLYSADSMAWSYAARKQGRDSNDWREARQFAPRIAGQIQVLRHYQSRFF